MCFVCLSSALGCSSFSLKSQGQSSAQNLAGWDHTCLSIPVEPSRQVGTKLKKTHTLIQKQNPLHNKPQSPASVVQRRCAQSGSLGGKPSGVTTSENGPIFLNKGLSCFSETDQNHKSCSQSMCRGDKVAFSFTGAKACAPPRRTKGLGHNRNLHTRTL